MCLSSPAEVGSWGFSVSTPPLSAHNGGRALQPQSRGSGPPFVHTLQRKGANGWADMGGRQNLLPRGESAPRGGGEPGCCPFPTPTPQPAAGTTGRSQEGRAALRTQSCGPGEGLQVGASHKPPATFPPVGAEVPSKSRLPRDARAALIMPGLGAQLSGCGRAPGCRL